MVKYIINEMKSQNCLSENWDVKGQVYPGGCEEAVNEFLETNIDIIGGAKSSFGMQNSRWKNIIFWS